ncbi:hypothetical protein RhiirA4_541120 [Rhizophagus irregularis]|uniref:F-box domain-containing protein n=1 Tax=Rhizophagus irregularis TaxID=588596 RepID=A0A2I1G9W1_9GLOM|nr:hypothetical protein RhiirA4_541120 [Rhizophagus irregularis]
MIEERTELSSLPTESLCEIFHYLEEDFRTLYSCLQVNRFWCKQIVTILWQNPMPNTYSSINLGVFINSFEEEIRLELEQNHGINVNELPKPLFNYEKYLKILNLRGVRHAVFYWLKNYRLSKNPFFDECINFNQNPTIDIIEKSLVKLILKNSYRIDHLILDLSRRYGDILEVEIFTNEEYSGIRNITKFSFVNNTSEICYNNIKNLLQVLPTLCTKIEIFKFYNLIYLHDEYETRLVNNIKNQNQLTSFDLSKGYINISRMIMALKYQATSLKRLTFNKISFIDFSYFSFDHLINLEYLEIEGTYPIEFILFPLSKANLKLKSFMAKFIEIDYNLKESILKSSKNTLEELYLEIYIPRINGKSPLCNICPNLSHLTISLCIFDKIHDHIIIFLNYINNLKNLSHLLIEFSCTSNNEILDKFNEVNLPCLKYFSFKFNDYSFISLKRWVKYFFYNIYFNKIIFYFKDCYLNIEQMNLLNNFYIKNKKNNFSLVCSDNFKFVAIKNPEF